MVKHDTVIALRLSRGARDALNRLAERRDQKVANLLREMVADLIKREAA